MLKTLPALPERRERHNLAPRPAFATSHPSPIAPGSHIHEKVGIAE